MLANLNKRTPAKARLVLSSTDGVGTHCQERHGHPSCQCHVLYNILNEKEKEDESEAVEACQKNLLVSLLIQHFAFSQ